MSEGIILGILYPFMRDNLCNIIVNILDSYGFYIHFYVNMVPL